MDKYGFACTSIYPDARPLLHNISVWKSAGLGPIRIALDLKSTPASYGRDYIQADYRSGRLSEICPHNTYARKNLAFIELIKNDVRCIFETDDDNQLLVDANEIRTMLENSTVSSSVSEAEISNLFTTIYSGFEDSIWARGYPIRWLDSDKIFEHSWSRSSANSEVGVVQFLVDGNPDLDAIVRLVKGGHINVQTDANSLPISLGRQIHPFNSQATLWPRPSFPLMYLPATCDFRMTDIWRGYIAQFALYQDNKDIRFEKSIVRQIRNPHRISSDFFGEHAGYAQTERVLELLREIILRGTLVGWDAYFRFLREAYEKLCADGIVKPFELELLDAWIIDLQEIGQ